VTVELRDVTPRTQLGVRLFDPRASAPRLRLPLEPNRVQAADGRTALWLGPDEWLVAGDGPLGLDLPPGAGSVVDLSANRVVLELRGPAARDVLAAGCALDLHPRAFGPGRCAQTLLARAAVILEQTSDEPAYRIYVRPSFAGYLRDWLDDASDAARTAGAASPPAARP
jgi:sarcosine oxidase subunit gamma